MKLNNHVDEFYFEVLLHLTKTRFPFLVGGGFALKNYTGVYRDTKDLDLFCLPKDIIRILKGFEGSNFKVEYTDSRWLAKIRDKDHFVDIIFDTVNNICTVDNSWFHYSVKGKLFGIPIKYISAEDLLWCKIYVQNRERFDGADINHLILQYGEKINWERVLSKLDHHWNLLLAQFLVFQFVYPSERNQIPKWLFDELLYRAKEQYDIPASIEKVCRGPIIDQSQYEKDIKEWHYKVLTIKTI